MKRKYQQSCALAIADDFLGERWNWLIVRELLIQPCRFKDLMEFLPGIGTNLLTTRLSQLKSNRVIERVNPKSNRSAYHLTEKGLELEPIVLAMLKWSFHHLQQTENDFHCHHWDLLALKSLFVAGRTNKQLKLQILSPELVAHIKLDSNNCTFEINKERESDWVIEFTLKSLKSKLKQGKLHLTERAKEILNCFEMI